MWDILSALVMYFIAGLTLKLGDDLLDELDRPDYSWIPLTIAGLLFGLLMTNSEWDLVLLSAIVIGVTLSGKVNRRQFSVGFILIGLLLAVLGIPEITDFLEWLTVLIILLLSAILDERGNDWTIERLHPRASKFFRYRFTLKVASLLLSLVWPMFILSAIGLWVFDLGYELSGWYTQNNIIQSSEEQGYSTHP